MRVTTGIALGILIACAGAVGCARSEDKSRTAERSPARTEAPAGTTGSASAALQRASKNNKFAFVLFYEGAGDENRIVRDSFQKAVRRADRSIALIEVNRADPAERSFVDAYAMRTAPLPVSLAIAPNGAVTGAFRSQDLGNAEKLKTALVSRGMQMCLKSLQERKMVIVCAQGKSTARNVEAMRGVNEFKADARYAAYTTVLTIDPMDASEASFLTQLKIDPKSNEASTALIVPPSYALGMIRGATTKGQFLRLLASASSGCGSGGCGPSGCGPVKK